jgi:hypothetical protein
MTTKEPNNMLPTELQPAKMIKLYCPKCGEIELKIYPNSSMGYAGEVPPCRKCRTKEYKKSLKK